MRMSFKKICKQKLPGMECGKFKFIEHDLLLSNLVMIFIFILHLCNKTLFRSFSAKSSDYRSCHDGQRQYNFSSNLYF